MMGSHPARAVAIAIAIAIAVGAPGSLIRPAAATAADRPATLLSVGGHLFAVPIDTYSGTGAPERVRTRWARDGGSNVYALDITAPGGAALTIGDHPIGPGGVSLSFNNGTCSTGTLTVLEEPVTTEAGSLTGFAADWIGCSSGSVRIDSTIPTAAVRADSREVSLSAAFGATATQVVTLRNVGNVELSMGTSTVAVRDGYDGAADFSVAESDCGASLAIDGTCDLTVAFRPTDDGARGGTLVQATTPPALGSSVSLVGSGWYGEAPNDRIADAITISSLPFQSWLLVSGATSDRLDPVCAGSHERTVWYRYRPPSDGRLALSTAGSWNAWDPTDTVIGVYRGSAPDDLTLVGCNDDAFEGERTSSLRLAVKADSEYWIVVGAGQHGSMHVMKLSATTAPADTAVGVSDWAVSRPTFYPYPDDYRDTTTTGATLAEPAWVSIDVFRAGSPGSVVRHADLGLNERGYTWRWNGADSHGTRVAAGSYTLRHRVTDLFGNVVSKDLAVTVSAKKLAWSTTSKTVDGSRFWKRAVGSASGRATVDGPTIVLKSGDEWAQAAYRLTLVDAAAYGKLRFEVVGRSTSGRKARISVWDTRVGAWTYETAIGPSRGSWRTPYVTAGDHMYGRYAYGLVEVVNHSGRVNWVIEKARVTYTYAVLK
jgi:hypothetical protein